MYISSYCSPYICLYEHTGNQSASISVKTSFNQRFEHFIIALCAYYIVMLYKILLLQTIKTVSNRDLANTLETGVQRN